MGRVSSKVVLIAGVLLTIGCLFYFDLGRYLSLDYLKAQITDFTKFYEDNRLATVGLYFVVYVILTALSFPGAAILTLLGGALFGVVLGTLIVSFASTIGATLAFLGARFIFRDYVQAKFGERLKAINQGIAKDGDFYLFTLRLVPIVPFFIINLAMGLTPISTWRYFLVSQVGMLLGTAVYVNAGTQLAQISSPRDIVSPGLLASFVLLGVFPLLSRKGLQYLKSRKALRAYPRPRRFDYNLVVIGAGAGGLVSAYIAAAVKAKVALIEKHAMGGDCLNTGCVPSKALIRSTKFLAEAKRAKELGIESVSVSYSFADIMARIRRVIKAIEPHDSVERYQGLGVDCIKGIATIKSPYEVEVNGKRLTTRNIIVATGGRPYVPAIPGLSEVTYYTSDTVWELTELPRRLLVLGGGAIGCELAQCFARLDAKVTMVEQLDRLLIREDAEIAQEVAAGLRRDGVDLRLQHSVGRFERRQGETIAVINQAGRESTVAFDAVLLAVGRKANTSGFGLQELGVRLASNGTVEADDLLRTNIPNIYVCGDVTGSLQFTHTAAHEAWYAAVNALFSPFKTFRTDYRVIPCATFTQPEVARVGHNELSAKEAGIAYEVSTYGIDDLDRAIADEQAYGQVKVLTRPGRDEILGVTIVGPHAGDMIAEFVTAMRWKLGLNKILSTIHIYPTFTEANKYAAGVWKKAHAPQQLLGYVARFHSWRRGEGFRLPKEQQGSGGGQASQVEHKKSA